MSNELKSTSWLPLKDGSSVAPVDCICLEGLQPVIAKLRQKGVAIAHKEDLLADFLNHPSWASDVRPLCPSGSKVFEKIGSRLAGQSEYVLGRKLFTVIADFSLQEFVDLFAAADSDLMPVASLVAALLDKSQLKEAEEAVKTYILPKVEGNLSADRYVRVLNHLSASSNDVIRPARLRAVYNHYLEEALQSLGPHLLLPQIRLCNRNKRWISTSALTYSTANISPENILDETQQGILERYESKPISSHTQLSLEVPGKIPFDEKTSTASAAVLWNSLKQLRADDLPEDALAALLAVLGDEESYLELYTRLSSQRRIDAMWHKLGISGTGKRFEIQMADAGSVAAINLLGNPFSATVHKEIDTFFDPFPKYREFRELPGGDQLFQLKVRPCNAVDLSCDEKLKILGNSVHAILSHVWQRNIDFDALWQDLTKSEQLDIEVAQQSILHSSPILLDKQLSVSESVALKEIFQCLHAERTRELIAERDGDGEGKRDAIDEQKLLRERLREKLVSDSETQGLLIGKIQNRLKSQSYEAVSIPFELFQNADDAVVELEELCGGTMLAGVRPESLRYSFRIEVDVDSKALRFFHWGRAINQFRVGEKQVETYNRDMENMLVLQGSGKDATSVARTGQFGLGFKSVFFVCDEPKVVSGARSRFCVKSGVYPERLSVQDESRLRQYLVNCEEREPCTGTVIELLCRGGQISPLDVLQRFSELAGYLVLFSRRIRYCHISSDQPMSWRLQQAELIPGVERVPLKSSISPLALLFRVQHPNELLQATTDDAVARSAFKHSYRSVLIHLSVDGLPVTRTSGPSDVKPKFPEIWITTPTGHVGTGTVLVNADFDVNPGRTQLRDTSHNQSLVQQMGLNFGQLLCDLYQKTIVDWTTVRTVLQLDDRVTYQDFWSRFWQACIPYASRDLRDPIRTILFADDCGVSNLIRSFPTIPTGLSAQFDGLAMFSEIKWQTAGLLSYPEYWQNCTSIEWVETSLKPGAIVSSGVARNISLFTELNCEELNLARVMKEMLRVDSCFPRDRADAIGSILNQIALSTPDGPGDRANTRKELQSATFLTEAATYSLASSLRVRKPSATLVDGDEQMRARFAPDDRVLATVYMDSETALSFFLACRGAVEDTPTVLADWCFAADQGLEKQKAVAEYLARGAKGYELQQQFAKRLSEFQASWLGDEELCRKATAHLTEYERAVVYGRMNRSLDLGALGDFNDISRQSTRSERDTFRMIESWWTASKVVLIEEHDRRIYPFGQVPNLELNATQTQLDSDQSIRRDWFTLLVRGQIMRLGHIDDQQRGFLEFFSNGRFLDLFTESTFSPDEFIRAIDDYLRESEAGQPYFHWMNQMLAYYQLSRWLPRYVGAFTAVTRPGVVLTEFAGLKDITDLPNSQLYSRSTGFDAPASSRTLSLGAHFILREIVRARLREDQDYRVDQKVAPLCFVPSENVRRIFSAITGRRFFTDANDDEMVSRAMYEAVVPHVDDPTFSGCFDIPFRLLAAKGDLGVSVQAPDLDLLQLRDFDETPSLLSGSEGDAT